ncbi:protein FAM149B1-like [Aplysia californica]|uniref:Protein FAM149B1-like n=1 Tax=Aplysia californica TaxID=6500 RepID=A0ABM1W3Z0_APLCA|nr:protein FAM149B1-like [Aplysia californica]
MSSSMCCLFPLRYEDNMEYKKQITPRRRRVGYPPITPNACVKDSVTSAAFDHMWQEIMSWMRDLLQRYTTEIADNKNGVISLSLINRYQATPMSREPSTLSQQRVSGGGWRPLWCGMLHLSCQMSTVLISPPSPLPLCVSL